MSSKFGNPFDPFSSFSVGAKSIMKDEKTEINRGLSSTSIDATKSFNINSQSELMVSKQLRIVSQHVKKGLIVLIANEGMGSNDEYGYNLMENIILGFSKNIELPQAIIFVNNAVKLLTKNSNLLDCLKEMKMLGTNIISSYDCALRHNVLETIKVGKVCSTGEISELIINANNLIRL
jgi:hypothetical protein